MKALAILTFAIGFCGVVIISWGVLLSAVSFVRLELRHLRGANICLERDNLRHHLGSYLLLGLEFLVAADIAKTIVKPTLQDVLILGSIVIIRTILNYFLNREMAGTDYCGKQQHGHNGMRGGTP